MNDRIFAWVCQGKEGRPSYFWTEVFSILGLLLAALILFTVNLSGLPLRDWDEGTVAQVAKEIWQGDYNSWRWLFPTLWGEPYLNKPPLIHDTIAFFYSFTGVNEFSARLPGALLTAFSVPLVYLLGREIFVVRTPALFSALIYLTLLPVVRHGRLAMLDGAVLFFQVLMMWCILHSRRDLRWSLGAGLAFGALCLTKGIMGLLLAAIALLFLFWDTPRLLTSFYLWLGLFIGSVPVFGWYLAQFLHYQQDFINTGIISQSLSRVYAPVEGHHGPPWYYLLEILKYSCPWLIPILWGLKLTWQHRNWGWGKLILVWSGVYLLVVSLMVTKLPWYILPIYPALALAGGAALAELWSLPSHHKYPPMWVIFFGFLSFVTMNASFYFAVAQNDRPLAILLGSVALTMAMVALLMDRRDQQFIPVLFWGMYVSLFLFILSPHWLWELNESFPVKPVALIVRLGTPAQEIVYTSFAYERPSLNFYSDRRIIPATDLELRHHWLTNPHPYLLLDTNALNRLDLKSVATIGNAPPNWRLITRDN
jgi:4-amino-4-deoxy-L-arabinose transferase-like glycosyltransferase